MVLITAAIFLPFLTAALMPTLYRSLGRRLGLVPLGVALVTLLLILLAPADVAGVSEWVPALGLNLSLQVDGWGRLMALLITGIGSLVFLYSILYLNEHEDLGKFYLYILLFMGAMLGVVFSANLLLLYMFWELTSISSFLLIGFWHTQEGGRYGALKSMLLTVGGGLALLGGITILGAIGGTYELTALLAQRSSLLAHPLATPALMLILIGAFSKSAQAPFHIWLPDAMSAPTPVSAYLHSATMVKAGLFLVGRLWPLFATHPIWPPLVGTIGMFTMALGGYLALQKTDLKAILAMSTISQLGLILSLFGFGTPEAAAAAVFHLLNHSTFKGLLFMVVGIIDHQTGTRDINRLSGLARYMPFSAALAAIGAASMAGVPLLNGFLSKEMFLEATLHSPFGVLAPIVATASSILTTAYCLVVAHKIFYGPKPQQLPSEPQEAPWLMLLPPAVLALLVVAIGVAPGLVEQSLVAPAAAAVLQAQADLHIALWHGFTPALLMSLVALGGGLLVYLTLPQVLARFRRWAPERYNANRLYDWLWWQGQAVERLAKRITNAQMTGLLRDYLIFILGAATLGVFTTLWLKGVRLNNLALAPIDTHEWILLGVVAAGALSVTLSTTRLAAIASIAMVGMPLSLWFALMRAPDLALTQLVVEVITTILFLVVFAHLPQLKVYPRTPGFQDINVVIALAVGVVAALFTLIANGNQLFPAEAAAYYLENALPEGGGTNVVNVILVDFRGFDTLFEITVFATAGLAIYTLIKLRQAHLKKGGGAP